MGTQSAWLWVWNWEICVGWAGTGVLHVEIAWAQSSLKEGSVEFASLKTPFVPCSGFTSFLYSYAIQSYFKYPLKSLWICFLKTLLKKYINQLIFKICSSINSKSPRTMMAQWQGHWWRIDLGLGCDRGLSLAAFSKSDLTCHRFPEWVWSVVTVQHVITGFSTRCFRKVLKCLGEKNHNTSLSLFPLNVNTSHILFSYLLRAAEICCAPKLLTLNEELVAESKWGLFFKTLKGAQWCPRFSCTR